MVAKYFMKFSGFWLLALLLTGLLPVANAAEILVQADRNPVGQDESFQLIFRSTEDPDGDPDFTPLEPFVDILNQSRQSNISVINGLYQSTKSWTLTLMPKRRGKIILPSISFGRDKSPPYELMVQGAVVRKDEQTEMFTQIDFDRTKLYVNQQLVVTHTLFSATNLTSYDLGDLKFTGVDAVVEPLGNARQYTKTIGQKPFLVIEQPYAVFPLGSGTMTLETVVSSAEQAVTRGSFYLPFGGAPKILRARAGGRQIQVLPVPDSATAPPWLPATGMQLTERWDQSPVKFVVGEPITRTVTLKAEGIAAAQLPDLSNTRLDGIKVYPDQPLLNDMKSDKGISGYSVQKIAFIPVKAGTIELPAIEVPWWNIESDQQQVARLPAQVIEVLPGADTQQQAAQMDAAPAQDTLTEEDHDKESSAEDSAPPLQLSIDNNASPWFFVSMVLTFLWLLTLLAWYFQSGKKVSGLRRKSAPGRKALLREARQALIQACDARDAQACRGLMLAWARIHFEQPGLTTLADVIRLTPEQPGHELARIDAVLYGGAEDSIDFGHIRQYVLKPTPANGGKPVGQGVGLEPLYRT